MNFGVASLRSSSSVAVQYVFLLSIMPRRSRFEPSTIKNKIKREFIANKNKKVKNQQKLQKRLAQAKLEATDPLAKKVGHSDEEAFGSRIDYFCRNVWRRMFLGH